MANASYYILMHGNIPVTGMEIDINSGVATKVYSTEDNDFIPIAGRKSEQELLKWWNRRSVPLGQGAIAKVLNSIGINTPQEYLVRNLGLSLSDHYWIKPYDSNLSWEQVNLFSNDFRDEIAEFSFAGVDSSDEILNLIGKTVFYPSASTQGELVKKWICEDGKRFLIKGNYGSSYQQSLNELIATKLHEMQGKYPFVEYKLCDVTTTNGQGIGCICENFASLEIEFIPAYDIVVSKKKDNDTSLYDHFISCCVEYGLKQDYVVSFLEYQILCDYILSNTDRHLNNFGILRNAKTGQFISMAPIFDSGNSLFWNSPHLPAHNDLKNISTSGFKKTETGLLSLVKNRKAIDIEKLPSTEYLRSVLSKDVDSDVKINDIIKGYEMKIAYLEKGI